MARSRESLFKRVGNDFESRSGATHEDFKVVLELITSIHRDDKRYKIKIIYRNDQREWVYKNRRGRSELWGLSTARSWGSAFLGWLRDSEYREWLLEGKKK